VNASDLGVHLGEAIVSKSAIAARAFPVFVVAAVLLISLFAGGRIVLNGKLAACVGYGYSYGYTGGPPSVTNVSPTVGGIAGGTSVTITGQGFCNFPSGVTFGGTAAASFVSNSDTQIVAVSPAHAVGTVDVQVTNTAGTSATSTADQFTYTAYTAYFQWYDKASPGMLNDNIHLINTSGSTAHATVTIGGTSVSAAAMAPGASTYVTFPQGTIGGPVMVNADQTIEASQRVQYYQSFNEVWAETAAQASNTSYFQWYDKVSSPGILNDNIHVFNPGTATATVTVSLPGATAQVFAVPAGTETYVSFPGKIGGPVTVSSTGSAVLASQRVQYYQSFNEVWAEDATKAASVSYFNWFDKASPGMMNDNIHLYNPGVSTATVLVSLPDGTAHLTTLAAGAGTYVTLPAGNIGGPVVVSSTGSAVLASQRVQYYQSFNEVWAESAAQASTTLYFSWYDKVSSPGIFNDNVHLLNPGTTSATVNVALPGATTQIVTVGAGTDVYVSFPGKIGGPVTITSSSAILASQRVQYYQSFNEIWGQ
jgi:hypothetical protein